jgi:hypothetical protein
MAIGERDDWTDQELDLIIADYFSMLDSEIRRSHYDETQHRQALMSLINRSNSSIEFKHHNISAVLQQLDLPWINGYKPRAHFQKTIVNAIDRYLSQHPTAQHPEVLANSFAERPQLFIEPPPQLGARTLRPEIVQRLVRKFDPAERDFRNRKLGYDGEEMVLRFEQHRLRQLDRPNLAKKIRWISQEEGAGASRIPSFLDGAINASKHGDFEQHSAEAFDQRPQARFWHRWYKFVEHGSLTKQRMRALF